MGRTMIKSKTAVFSACIRSEEESAAAEGKTHTNDSNPGPLSACERLKSRLYLK